MSEKKKSFILYAEDYRFFRTLADSQKAALLDAIFLHALGAELPALDPTTEMAFHFISAQLDRDHDKWEATRRARIEAGRKGGLARARNAALQAAEANQANQAVSVSESVSESESVSASVSASVSESVAGAEAGAVPPAVDAVAAYCRARNNGIDAGQFCDYYAARGWRLGNAVMTDWKAAVRGWERREPRASPAPPGGADAPLADWERDWLAEVEQRKKQRGEAPAFLHGASAAPVN